MRALLQQSGKHLAHGSRQTLRMLAACLVALLFGTPPGAVAATTSAAATAAESLYRAKCSVCHDSGAGNAPRLTQRQDWVERTARGRATLYARTIRTINGIPNSPMAARGGFNELSDAELRSLVDYMLDAAGHVNTPMNPVDGVAKLSGAVQDASLISRAEALAASTPGVRPVINRIIAGAMLDFD